jgi:hypothetical protein
MSVDVFTEIFFTRRASPVQGAKTDKSSDDKKLHDKNSVLRECAEESRTLMEQGKQYKEKQRHCYGKELAALTDSEVLDDLPVVFFLLHFLITCAVCIILSRSAAFHNRGF